MRRTLVFFLAIVAVIGIGACSGGDAASPSTAATSGDSGRGATAPMFEGPLLSGGSLSLESLRGSPVIVNFWTTTCRPCIREMPLFAEAVGDNEADGLVVVGVNYGEQEDRVRDFIDGFEVEIGYPIVLDLDGAIGRQYRVAVLPMTYFIDRDGVIQYRRIAEVEEDHLAEGLSRIR